MRKSTSNSSLVAQLTNEVQNGVVLSRAYDALNRPTGYSLEDSLRSLRSLRLEYSYDTLGRFSGVGFNAEPQSRRGFEYQYLAGSDLVSGYVASAGDSGGVASRPLLVRSVAYEPHRDLIAAVVPAASPDGWDEMSAVTGRVFVAQTPETFEYDADGCQNWLRYRSAPASRRKAARMCRPCQKDGGIPQSEISCHMREKRG